MRRGSHIKFTVPVVALLLMLGAGAEALTRPRPAGAEPYHAGIRKIVKEEMPSSFSGWAGSDTPVTKSAVELLKPNVIYSRQFFKNNRRVSVMIVHCKDTRDIDGHYPAICYPANGWELQSKAPGKWQIDALNIEGIGYEFTKHKHDGGNDYMYIDNFILMPDGRIVPDMAAVRKQSADFMTRFHGAANVQIVFYDRELGKDEGKIERDEIFTDMVHAHMPLIKAILAGVSHSEGGS